MTTSYVLRSRLYRDLAELRDIPYPGVAVFTDDADMLRLCLVLTPPSGPWKDLSLHFYVRIPENWPTSPPTVRCSVPDIDHPNLFGDYICCDLLKEQSWLEKGYTGGYTPALTLRGLFLQFLTFFSSTKVEQDYGGEVKIGDSMVSCYRAEYRAQELIASGAFQSGGEISSKKKDMDAWDANPSAAMVLDTIMTRMGPVVHSVKKSGVRSDRIHKFEWRNPRWFQAYELVSEWKCRLCPYGSEALPHHRANRTSDDVVTHPTYNPPFQCLLHKLNDDVLLFLASYLPSESVISFSQAYTRFAALVKDFHVLTQRELQCFFLRTPLQDSILGIGVSFDPGPRTLSSDFDWLSETAFNDYTVRKSIQKRDFQHFLPLAFSPYHFDRAVDKIWRSLIEIERAVRRGNAAITRRTGRTSNQALAPPKYMHEGVNVVYRMMNNIVVSLMKSCDDALDAQGRSAHAQILHASEKAVISYCHLFHLLICLSRKEPRLLRGATMKLRAFVLNPRRRVKEHTPDLGELIVLAMLVLVLPPVDNGAPMTWAILNGPFLQEAIVRNARWVLKDSPELEVMELGTSDYRLATTFMRSKTSLRLIMFQIAFLDMFIGTYASDISRLDNSYGFAETGLPERMVEEIKAIYQVGSWPMFFRRVKYARGMAFGKEKFSQMLRDAVRVSAQRGYHIPKAPRELEMVASRRRNMEPIWLRERERLSGRP